jgi:hypothetical protein
VIAGVRILQRLRPPPANGASGHHDLSMPSRRMNALLLRLFSSERYVVGALRIPFGVSLIVLARA